MLTILCIVHLNLNTNTINNITLVKYQLNEHLKEDDTFTEMFQIRIISPSFKFPSKNANSNNFANSRGIRGWNVMKEECLEEKFPLVTNLSQKMGLKVHFLYNAHLHRIDIHFLDPKTKSKKLLLMIKAGLPDTMDNDNHFVFFGSRRGKF